ncbi:MAG: HD-GYP domain-containing protein, partial [Acidobacteriota bacterium]
GAMDYLIKPLDLDELERAVQGALRRREERRAMRELDQRAKEAMERERAKAARLTVATLEALVNAMEARDPYLRGHSARVADLAATIAAHLGLAEDMVEAARLAGRLHDIGKIGTRESVLNKHGPLSPEENEHIKQHVLIGSQLLAPIDELRPILGGVRNHHERWDGSGYPDGLKGEEIPLLGRIIGAAEIYDALSTSRPYQDKMSPYEAVQRMSELVGTALDPRVYASLAEVIHRRRSLVFLEGGDTPGP